MRKELNLYSFQIRHDIRFKVRESIVLDFADKENCHLWRHFEKYKKQELVIEDYWSTWQRAKGKDKGKGKRKDRGQDKDKHRHKDIAKDKQKHQDIDKYKEKEKEKEKDKDAKAKIR